MRRTLIVLAALTALLTPVWLSGPSGWMRQDPGPVFDLTAALAGQPGVDPQLGQAGALWMTTVQVTKLRRHEWISAKLAGDVTLVPERHLGPAGMDGARLRMRQALRVAAYVAASGVDPDHVPSGDGVLLVSVEQTGPAGRAGLKAGDVIVGLDGDPVTDLAAFLGRSAAAGQVVEVAFERSGHPDELEVELRQGRFGVEVTTYVASDPRWKLDVGGIGGSSAGLMSALTFLDAAGEGDLTAGRRIAGTGTISLDGTVGAVSGVAAKVAAAEAEGAQLFLVPPASASAAVAAAEAMPVVVVGSFLEAVTALCSDGADDVVCSGGSQR